MGFRMARKRTPTKDVNSHNIEGKEKSFKPIQKPSFSKDDVSEQSKPCLKASHLTLITIFMTFITALVCHSVYPEFTSLTEIKRNPMPSLRHIVDSNKNSHSPKDGVGADGIRNVFQPNRESESIPFFDQVSNWIEASDKEAARIAAKISELKTQKIEGSKNAKLSEDMENLKRDDVEVKEETSIRSESESQVKVPVNGFNNVELSQDIEDVKSNIDALDMLSFKDSKSDSSLSKNRSIHIKPHNIIVNSKDTKNVEMQRSTSSEEKVLDSLENVPLRKEKSKKTGPIMLSAGNPHISLSVNDIQSEPATQRDRKYTNKKSLNSKQAQKKETKKNLVKKNSQKILPKNKVDDSKLSAPGKEKAKTKTGRNTKAKNSMKQEQISKGSSTSQADSKSSDSEFKPSFQRTFTPTKTFYGGRRIAPVELLNQEPSNSSVKVYLFDDFLSQQECEGLMSVHNEHIRAHTKPPILCFDSLNTLQKHIRDAGKRVAVSSEVFTAGTSCVNESFSLQLQGWLNSNWSYSTAFYPGESKFSTNVARRLQQSMGLQPESGGKFQITSYPLGKAYKTHTDCTEGGEDKRDRVVSVLMYLNDAEDGGETKFPDLGIWVKPKRGRAIVWNNMSPSGECEPHSRHAASVVKKGKKYILIRWYYYQSFQGLGHRPSPPQLPVREDNQAKVSCDDYDNGSCRWYDEWTYEHLLEYQRNKLNLS